MSRFHATVAVIALVGTLATAAGCGPDRNPPSPSTPAATSAASTNWAYQVPTSPCDAVSSSTATQAGLTFSVKRSFPLYVPDQQGQPVSASIDTCTWTAPNPARGPNGRPNQFSAVVGFTVIDPKLGNATELAQLVYEKRTGAQDKKDVTVVREAPSPVPADEGRYVYLTEKSVTGAGSTVQVVIRRANAVVEVSFSGADLTNDPTRPKGLQLVTAPVDEARLRPTVEVVLSGALTLLKEE